MYISPSPSSDLPIPVLPASPKFQFQQNDMDTLPLNGSNPTITFAIIGSFSLIFLLTVCCLIRHSATAYSVVVRSLSGPPPPAPASTLRRNGEGVDSATVNALPLVSYGAGAEQRMRNADDCAVCLSEFEEKETVKLIPHCRHVFHAECLDTWLASHVSCPLCRTTQFFKTAGDEVRLHVDQ